MPDRSPFVNRFRKTPPHAPPHPAHALPGTPPSLLAERVRDFHRLCGTHPVHVTQATDVQAANARKAVRHA